MTLFDSDSSAFELTFYVNNRPTNSGSLYFKANTDAPTVAAEQSEQKIALRYTAGPDKYIEYQYTLAPGKYQVDLNIVFQGMEDLTTQRTGVIDLNWMISSPQQEKGRTNEMQYTSLYYKPFEDVITSYSIHYTKLYDPGMGS